MPNHFFIVATWTKNCFFLCLPAYLCIPANCVFCVAILSHWFAWNYTYKIFQRGLTSNSMYKINIFFYCRYWLNVKAFGIHFCTFLLSLFGWSSVGFYSHFFYVYWLFWALSFYNFFFLFFPEFIFFFIR